MASLESKSESESCIDIVSVDGYSFDQIVQHIVNARRDGTESIISLHCPADAAWDLGVRIDEKLVELDQIKIHRFEYDYQSGIAYIDIMPETNLHFQMLAGTHNHTEISLARFIAMIPDAALRQRIVGEILDFGTADIAKEGKILKQGDFAFGTIKNKLPSLSEPRSHVERKVVQYIECAEGDIQATIVLDVQYPRANRAKVALRVADGTTAGTWVRNFETIYDDDLVKQPEGEVGLYISDFLGPAGLPTAFCRPSAAETAAGVQRDPQVLLTYERLRNIFLKARAIYQGTYKPGDGGEEDNVYTIVQSAERERERAERERERAERERERAERERERADIVADYLAILEERERERADILEERERELEERKRELEERKREQEERKREQEHQIAMLQEQVRQLQKRV
ncbi:hypothetical protein B0T25DRAFT_491617 [Lasiosphaeria hispida]|uniref:Uncharacterized protein n=1 Tax=Lasiosphaeria hispida TaxID=260671 RepID=A0AAJ0HUY8_9PEZI|nr:hypothetical protein B0T25DRAFT_491617 [Lasiosphaeria hispida]